MSEAFGRGYVLRARTQPVFIVALPLIAFLLYMEEAPRIGVGVPLVSALGILALSQEVLRRRGRKLEKRLLDAWGGFPTTAGLRWSGGPLAARRRQELERFTGVKLPDQALEASDPSAADMEYQAAVRVAIRRIGRKTLLQTENISYGFRRNLLAWKRVALWLVGISVAMNAAVGYWTHFPWMAYAVWLVDLAIATIWITAVNDEWVHDQAKTYAEQFFTEVTSATLGPA